MNTDNQQNGVQDGFFAQIATILNNNTIGGLTEENSTLDNSLNLMFSNLSKINAQIALESILMYSHENNKDIEFINKINPDVFNIMQTIQNIEWAQQELDMHVNRFNQFSGIQQTHIASQYVYTNIKEELDLKIETSKKLLQEYSDKHGLNLNVDSDSFDRLRDKTVGSGFSKIYNQHASTVFDYGNYLKLVYDAANINSGDEQQQADYFLSLLTVMPKLSGAAFVEGSAGYIPEKWAAKLGTIKFTNPFSPKVTEFFIEHSSTFTAKSVTGMLARGVIVGIATELAYHGGYKFGTLLFDDLFDYLYGETAYEYYADEFDALYSFIFQDLKGDELIATIAFNTMLLGNFVNREKENIIYEDTAILFGADDYKDMDFKKVSHTYKGIYKLLSGKDDAQGIEDAQALVKHMHQAYQIFKQYRGKELFIPQSAEDWQAFLNLALQEGDAGIAYRYALLHLNPFALDIPSLYAEYNQNHELDLYDPNNPDTFENGLTVEYLTQRMKMLDMIRKIDESSTALHKAYTYIDEASDYQTDPINREWHANALGFKEFISEVYFGSDEGKKFITKNVGHKKNYIFGGRGEDRLYAEDGDDYIEGNQGKDTLVGGRGNDRILGGSDNDTIYGGQKMALFNTKNDHDSIFGGDGDDEIYAGNGNDYINGGRDDDTIRGEGGNDTIIGGEGVLIAKGGDGNDYIISGNENDNTLEEGSLQGGSGNDIIEAGAGEDHLRGGSGNDTLYAGNDNDTDILEGDQGNDILYASDSNNDILKGGKDSDLLISGNDFGSTLEGGIGSDRLIGKEGYEVYRFKSTEMTGTDSIKDSDGTGIIEIDGQNFSLGEFNKEGRYWESSDGKFEIRYLKSEDGQNSAVSINKKNEDKNTIFIEDFQQGHFGLNFDVSEENWNQIEQGRTLRLNNGSNIAVNTPSVSDYWTYQTIMGLGGNDRLMSNGGSLYGGAGNDFISKAWDTSSTDSYLDGGTGNDLIFGDQGHDYISGGTGNDFIMTSSRPQRELFGQSLIQWFNGDSRFEQNNPEHRYWQFDTMDFYYNVKLDDRTGSYAFFWQRNDNSIGPELLFSYTLSVNYYGKKTDIVDNYGLITLRESIVGLPGSDYVSGGAGNDFITGSIDADELHGGDDNDYVLGLGGDDKIFGGAGSDNLFGGAGRDFIDGGDDVDRLVGGYGDDILYGGEGDDNIEGDVQNLIGTDAPPPLTDFTKFGADLIYGGKGDDTIWANDGNDIVHGGADEDKIDGGDGDDYLYGDDGYDTIFGGDDNDYLFGGDGIDVLDGGDGDDQLFGNKHQDYLYGGEGDDKLSAGDGDDELHGEDDNDILEGGIGADYLYGGDGHDILIAGKGQDVLEGGEGSDIYIFDIGDGKNEIRESLSDIKSSNEANFIHFKFSAEQVTNVSNVNNKDLLITFGETDSVTVKDYFIANNYSNHASHCGCAACIQAMADTQSGNVDMVDANDPYDNNVEIAQFRFTDGSVWDTDKIMSMAPPPENPFVEPDPIIDANNHQVSYFIDSLISRYDIAVLGKKTITYGFLSNRNDELKKYQAYTDEQRKAVKLALDKFSQVLDINFVENYDNELDFTFYLDDLSTGGAAAYAGYASAQTGEVHINSTKYGRPGQLQPGEYGFEVLLHEIGHAMGLKHPFEAPVLPTAENNENNTIMSYTSNDENDTNLKDFDIAALQYLYGVNPDIATGDDNYTFDDKYIIDASGTDTFNASKQTKDVHIDLNQGGWSYVNEKNDSILAPNQTFINYGTLIEKAVGGSGNDTLVSNELNNTLTGGTGQDTYIFNQGDGIDTIVDTDTDSIIVLEDINIKQIYTYKGALYYSAGGDGLVVNMDHIQIWKINGEDYTSEQIQTLAQDMTVVEGETTLTANMINAILAEGIEGNLKGNKKDNILIGNDQNNLIHGDGGEDQMAGGKGDDTYHVDHIEDSVIEKKNEGNDTVIAEIDYTLTENVENLKLSGLKKQPYHERPNIEWIDKIAYETSEPRPEKGIGNELNNRIIGNYSNNILDGRGGADILVGYDGNDTYYVDDIGDVVIEAARTDSYGDKFGHGRFLTNYRIDEVWGGSKWAGNDTVISSINYTLGENLENLVLEGEALIAVGNDEDNKITGNDKDNTLYGNNGTDTLLGGKGNDILWGGSSDDILKGGSGDDTYLFDASYGDDTLIDTEGNNHIVFENIDTSTIAFDKTNNFIYYNENQSSSIELTLDNNTTWKVNEIDYTTAQFSDNYGYDVVSKNDIVLTNDQQKAKLISGYYYYSKDITGNHLNNTLIGNQSKNVLTGGLGNDTLKGHKGEDTLNGGEGDDILIGGENNDRLIGGLGVDHYYFNQGDGRDTWIEERGNDSKIYLDGVLVKNLIPTSKWEDYYTSEQHPNYKFLFYGDDSTLSIYSETNDKDRIYLKDFNRATNNYGLILEQYSGIDDNAIKPVEYTDDTEAQSYVYGSDAEDSIHTGGGNDWVTSGKGNDTVYLGSGNDEVIGGLGNDKLYGGDGNDRLFGYNSDGYASNSIKEDIEDIEDRDYIVGGDGNDLIDGGVGDDTLIAGMSKEDNSIPYNEQLKGRNQNQGDWITGHQGNDRIWGSGGKDMLNGGIGEDEIHGNNEDDIILGDAHYNWNRSKRDNLTIAEAIFDGDDYINNSYPNHPDMPGYYATDYVHQWDFNGLKESIYTLGDYEKNSYLFNVNVYNEDFSFNPLIVERLKDQNFERIMSGSTTNNADTLYGGAGNDWIAGQLDSDYLYGGSGNDRLYGDDVTSTAEESGDDHLYGGSGDDTLKGGFGDDVLNGGSGNDNLEGGNGQDTYILNKGDGIDSITDTDNTNILKMIAIDFTDISYQDGTLYYNKEQTDGIINFDPSLFDSIIIGSQTYTGEAFETELKQLNLLKSNTNVAMSEESKQGGILLTGDSDTNATGNSQDNTLIGNTGNNKLNGAGGNDKLQGGQGDDIYFVDSEKDEIIEFENEGNDTVKSTILTTKLSQHVENLELIESDNLENMVGIGNALDNTIIGNKLDNEIDGVEGADLMQGGLGDDTYHVDNLNDQVIEEANEGLDEVITSIDGYQLADNVEVLTLKNDRLGQVINATGNDLNNTINGNYSNNIINGGLGDDILRGGEGSDTYIIMKGEGTDTVQEPFFIPLSTFTSSRLELGEPLYRRSRDMDKILSDTSIDLSKHSGVEVAELIGNESATLKGRNDVSESLIGNDADNILEGSNNQYDYLYSNHFVTSPEVIHNRLTPSPHPIFPPIHPEIKWNHGDMLQGGLGDDTYIIYSKSDYLLENTDEGIDTVEINTDELFLDKEWSLDNSYILGNNIENLTLTGQRNFNGNGNELDNIIIGNTGHNRLDGGQGADIMQGGLGDDVYKVDNIDDKVVELVNQGNDRIESSISIEKLVDNVESINLMGSENLNAHGNGLDNLLVGNKGRNIISGDDGDDTINGNVGNDILTGGSGSDTFVFNTELSHREVTYVNGMPLVKRVSNVDRITDFSLEDVLELDDKIFNMLDVGQLNEENFVSGSRVRAQDENDFILYDTRSGRLYVDTNADERGGKIHFATLENKMEITAEHFTVV